ncbi:MAG TPA: hypothetical protein VF589_06210 [Allosphingosinicella sp.]|jgi:hypothetical protein
MNMEWSPSAATEPAWEDIRRLLAPLGRIPAPPASGNPIRGLALGMLISIPLWAGLASVAVALASGL